MGPSQGNIAVKAQGIPDYLRDPAGREGSDLPDAHRSQGTGEVDLSFSSEVELAKVVISWLKEQHWEVYQEVKIHTGGSIADIVARQGNILWVIETKLSLGFTVLDQAYNWKPWAHYISVATPRRRKDGGSLAYSIMRNFGIGLLLASHYDVHESIRPVLNRRCPKDLLNGLNEKQKNFSEAGNNFGSHWSPWKQTCQSVSNYVQNHPGCTLKELISNVTTHYSSASTARSCIKIWIESGKINGVRMEKERPLRLFPV